MKSKSDRAGMFVRLPARVCALVVTLMLLSASALASFKADVYKGSMPVYSSPATSATKLGSLESGTEVTVSAYSGDWAKISYKGYSGYAQIKYLSSQKRAKAYAKDDAVVYTMPSSSSKKLGTLSAGDCVYMVGKCDSYYLIENSSGSASGYIDKSSLTSKKPSSSDDDTAGAEGGGDADDSKYKSSMPSSLKSDQSSCQSSSSDSDKIEYVIYVAQYLLGRPYSTSPSAPKSFDCAGFTRFCYKQVDVTLNASAYGQGYDSDYTKIKDASDLERGDVVIFDTNDSDSDLSDHTGIYLGGGYFIHASSGAGQVIVSSLSSGYYSGTFSWGLRIFD